MRIDLLRGLSPAQAEAVTSSAAPLAIVAGPGSGKTRVLTRRVVHRCLTGVDPSHALVLTFTRRAASELLARLGRLGLPVGARQGGVVAGTFHAVAFSQVSRYRAERGLPALGILGRPARLLAPALALSLGRDPSAGEVAAVTRQIAQGDVAPEWHGAADAYGRAKRVRRVLDLDDLLAECTRLLREDPAAADAARWRHRHVFVDEYQDLNPAHRRLLQAWVGDRADVCVVGDPDQAIYGFNGAPGDVFDRVTDDWPGAQILTLRDNFRSTPEIVAIAGALAPCGVSTQPPGPIPTLTGHPDEDAEAAAVAAAINARRAPGRAWSGMAILARTNARLRVVARALGLAGIPWRLRDPRPLADRDSVRGWLEALPPGASAADLVELADDGDGPDRTAMLRALAEFRTSSPDATIRAFASWLDATGVTADEGDATGVDLVTFHRSKGLEWPAVWIVGAEEGLVPLSNADVDEERRLLYVAVTRAADELAVSWSESSGPSRWMADLEDARARLGAAPPREAQVERFAVLCSSLRRAG